MIYISQVKQKCIGFHHRGRCCVCEVLWGDSQWFVRAGKRLRERGREIAAGGPQHDWWVWNNWLPSCVFHQTHSSHLTLSLCPPRSLCNCKQRPLGMWFLCDGQKSLSHLWQEYPHICTTTAWILHHLIFPMKKVIFASDKIEYDLIVCNWISLCFYLIESEPRGQHWKYGPCVQLPEVLCK